METKWNIMVVRYSFLFLCVLSVMTADTGIDKQFGREYSTGFRLNNIRYNPPGRKLISSTNRQKRGMIRALIPLKGDLCNEDSSDCQSQEQDPSFSANIRIEHSRNRFNRPKFARPIFIAHPAPDFQYSHTVPSKHYRLDAVDVMEHLFVKALEYGGWKNPAQKKKKLTMGKGNRPMIWNESEDDDYDDDLESDDNDPLPFSPYKPTGNIYHAGNKYYSGSHDHINLFKKYGVTKYKHAKYHLKPLVNFESPDDYDDLWDREYERSLRLLSPYSGNFVPLRQFMVN